MALPLIAPLTAALMKGFKLGATGLGLMGGAPVGAAKAGAGALNLIKQAYTPNAMGLMNLGMDVIPLAMDISNNDVGLKSFSSFGGTLLGTKFGGRELNKLGEEKINSGVLQRARDYDKNKIADRYAEVNKMRVARGKDPVKVPSVEDSANRYKTSMTAKLQNDPQYSKQGYNMPIGFAADAGLYSLTTGMNKPKPTDSETLQGQSVSPVTRYMQMTGGL